MTLFWWVLNVRPLLASGICKFNLATVHLAALLMKREFSLWALRERERERELLW